MTYMPILVLVACGALFYRAATYERMAGWAWATMSVGLSAVVMQFGGIGLMLLAQVALFIVMWVYNAHRRAPPKE